MSENNKQTQNDKERNRILQTHKLFGRFLDLDIINALILLFDGKEKEKITNYIQNERKLRGLNDNNITIESSFYGVEEINPTVDLIIKKNDKDFIHLSIHLPIKFLSSGSSGIIHIRKNIYEPMITKKTKKLLYALISVIQPEGKPNSLEFSIDVGYNTKGIANSYIHDKEIQEEMDVIITVLNRIFDENNKEYYIGNKKELKIIHPKANNAAEIINTFKNHATRKNRKKTYFPLIKNIPNSSIEYKNKSKYKRKTQRKVSKRKIQTRSATKYKHEYKRKTQKNPSKRRGKIQTRPATESINNNINLNLFANKNWPPSREPKAPQ